MLWTPNCRLLLAVDMIKVIVICFLLLFSRVIILLQENATCDYPSKFEYKIVFDSLKNDFKKSQSLFIRKHFIGIDFGTVQIDLLHTGKSEMK